MIRLRFRGRIGIIAAMTRILAAALLSTLTAGCRTVPVRRPPPSPPPLAKAVVRTARRYLPEEEQGHAVPVDCSDFVGKVYRANGIKLPRTSEEMSREGEPVNSSAELRMGDLLFFSGSGGGRAVGHVAIYVNNGIFIHQANPGEGVRMESLYSDYYRKRYLKARRIIN